MIYKLATKRSRIYILYLCIYVHILIFMLCQVFLMNCLLNLVTYHL